jgi:G protein-coupled receptor GPR1
MESSREPSSGLITGSHRFMWASLKAPDDSAPTPPSEPSILEIDSFIGPSTSQPILQFPSAASISPRSQSFTPSESRATSSHDGFVRRFSPDPHGNSSTKHSIADIFTVLRQHPHASEVSTPRSQLQLMNSRGQTFADAEMLRTRDKIRRQLRFLFIYPLVYIGIWILPFISHVLQYDDRYALNTPFGLTCITTICICSQAAVDSWLFSTREKPWRHIPGGGGGFWESLKFWSGGTWNSRKTETTHGPGKTREEMVREARAAYKRRDEELAQRKTKANVSTPHRDSQKTEKSWWEATGLDGTMSPVAEEMLNPMEAVIVSDSATLSPISEHSPSDSEATSTTRSAEALEVKDDAIESVSKKEQC